MVPLRGLLYLTAALCWQTILITHHHYDHVGGIEQVQSFYDTPIPGA